MTKEDIIGKEPSMWMVILVNLGMLLIVAGTLIPVLRMGQINGAAQWIYAAGALLTLAGRLFTPYGGKVVRIKRLHRIEAWSAIFFCVGAFFMFYNPSQARDWLAFTLAGGVIQVYSSIMIPYAIKKELNRKDK